MKIVKRLAAAVLALVLLAGVVYLGLLSGDNSRLVAWFGIASAIAAPIGLSLIAFAVSKSDRAAIERLNKVPEIARLVQEAQSQEEKVRLLEAEHARLADVVRLESRRQAATDRIESLEQDAVRIFRELALLEKELRSLDGQVGDSHVSEEIRNLHARVAARQHGDFIVRVGSQEYRIDREILQAIPFGLGLLLTTYLRLVEKLQSGQHERRDP